LQHRPAERGVGPGVGEDDHLDRGELALGVAGDGELHVHRVPLDVVGETLGAGELHLDRLLQVPGHERGVVLHAHVLLAAEAAADEHRAGAHLLDRQLEHPGDLVLLVVDRLPRGVHPQPVADRGSATAHSGSMKACSCHGVLNLRVTCVCRLADRLVGVAALDVLDVEDVAVLVDERRSRGSRAICGEVTGGERLVVELDEGEDLVELLLVGGGDEGQGVTDVAGALADRDHHVPVVHDVADLVLRHVRRGQHGEAVRVRLGSFAHVDALNSPRAVGERSALAKTMPGSARRR
jgi:hypothetical protein